MQYIKLPPADCVTGKSYNNYAEYKLWRKSNGYKLWLKKQWNKQKGKCAYCKCDLRYVNQNVEHVMPQWLNTRFINSARNLVLSCQQCNKNKGGKIIGKKKRPKFN